MNSGNGDQLACVERLMTLSEREFANSIGGLLPLGAAVDKAEIVVPLPTGRVTITYEVLPSVRIGPSLELPRLRVVLTFTDAGQTDCDAFVARFDVAFQRGGG